MRKIAFSLILASIVFLGCDKNKNMTQAIVVDTKDLSNEGCGYLLLYQDSTFEKPNTLPSAYRYDGRKVWVKTIKSGGASICNWDGSNKYYDNVNIEEIRNDLD